MSVSKRLVVGVACLAITALGFGSTARSAQASVIDYVNAGTMANGSQICAQSCQYASRTYNEVFRANFYDFFMSGAQSGTGWSYGLNSDNTNPYHVSTSSARWPLTAACKNVSGATRSGITCETDY